MLEDVTSKSVESVEVKMVVAREPGLLDEVILPSYPKEEVVTEEMVGVKKLEVVNTVVSFICVVLEFCNI